MHFLWQNTSLTKIYNQNIVKVNFYQKIAFLARDMKCENNIRKT